ncbi:MAG TPA: PDZ domain-containing protein [Acidobacteriota bacterium]|nr:PDZ domain-containing protein [Acidobacteriota bacterium]
MLAGVAFAAASHFQEGANDEAEPILVRVNLIIETRGAKDTVQINGKLISNYSPIIIQDFPSTGIVLDHQNHIMTFLGYRWVDIQDSNARVVITASKGRKWSGKLIGIDQSNGVAVLQLLDGKLQKTPVCIQCDLKDGVMVMAPILENSDGSELREAQVLSVGTGPGSLDPGALVMKTSRPIPGIGLPVLTKDRRVIGFVAGLDPVDMQTVVYPISQLIASAEKILKAGGDIRTGWLGVFLNAPRLSKGPGVKIQRVVENSPAQRAGLLPGDELLKIDGREITDALQFIQFIQNTPIGSSVKLDVVRQGESPVSRTALIEARKPHLNGGRLSFNLTGSLDPTANGIVPELTPPGPRLLMGLSTEMLNPALADALRLPGQTGLLVLEVAHAMPAEQAGILAGDIILSIDGQPIMDAPSFASFLMTHAWNSQSILRVLRKGVELTIAVQLPDEAK